jgi:hypothetical protein
VQRTELVAHVRPGDRAGAEAAQHLRQRDAVGVSNLAGARHGVDRDDLVAGRDQRDGRTPVDVDALLTERRQDAEQRRVERRAGPRCERAGGDVFAGGDDVGPGFDGPENTNGVRLDDGVFNANDRVGAERKRCAGCDAHRRARCQRRAETGPRLARQLQ